MLLTLPILLHTSAKCRKVKPCLIWIFRVLDKFWRYKKYVFQMNKNSKWEEIHPPEHKWIQQNTQFVDKEHLWPFFFLETTTGAKAQSWVLGPSLSSICYFMWVQTPKPWCQKSYVERGQNFSTMGVFQLCWISLELMLYNEYAK